MKKHTLFSFALMSLSLVSCSTNMMSESNKWELEYISGPRITFQGLITHYKIESDGKITLLMGDMMMIKFKKSLK